MEKLKNRKWKVLTSEYLAHEPWFTVRHESLELPDGRRIPDYYVLEYPDWINVIAITAEGMFVLVRQYRHGIGQTCHEIVAGVMEQGEQPEAAARRELMEETGFGGGTWRETMVVSPNASTVTNVTHCFVATGVERIGSQHLDPTEDIEVCLVSREEMRRMLEQGEIKQALMAAPLWRYFAENP